MRRADQVSRSVIRCTPPAGSPQRISAISRHRVSIIPYRDGPLLIRGDFELLDADGNAILSERKPVALCRCGKSRIKPFCDGTHKLTGFRAPSGREPYPTLATGAAAPGGSVSITPSNELRPSVQQDSRWLAQRRSR